jgi:hypothetical protein
LINLISTHDQACHPVVRGTVELIVQVLAAAFQIPPQRISTQPSNLENRLLLQHFISQGKMILQFRHVQLEEEHSCIHWYKLHMSTRRRCAGFALAGSFGTGNTKPRAGLAQATDSLRSILWSNARRFSLGGA